MIKMIKVDRPQYIVVNFSGGKDSTAMLFHMIELGQHIDEVVCCDVGKEFPAMYRHIDKVREIVQSEGIKFTVLKADKPWDYWMFEHEPKVRNGNPSRDGYGWALVKGRWCTRTMKIDTIGRYFRELRKQNAVVMCIGIAIDETGRVNNKNNSCADKRMPLVEWGWTEKDCLEYCYAKGFDRDGLYEIFHRVSCWCCPLQSLQELRNLREHFPDLWEELKDMDKRAWNQFKADYSVEDLEIRFDLEKEFLAHGKSIRNKEFFAELKRRLGKEEQP